MERGQVLWLKALDGRPDRDSVIGANSRSWGARKRLEDMGRELQGSCNVLAVYLKKNPDPRYHRSGTPGAIVGFVRLSQLTRSTTVDQYPYDEHFDIGWPMKNDSCCWCDTGPLRDIMSGVYRDAASERWRTLCGSMRGGRPVSLIDDRYRALGDELTRIYRLQ